MGIKEVHSEPTSEECNSLLCFHLSNRFFLSVYPSFSLPTLFTKVPCRFREFIN